MKTLIQTLFSITAAMSLLFLAVIVGTLLGAIFGWIVGLFFGQTILNVLAEFGVQHVAMWQFGAFLGFVGGFFRSTCIR